jgi:hypothetical protein
MLGLGSWLRLMLGLGWRSWDVFVLARIRLAYLCMYMKEYG